MVAKFFGIFGGNRSLLGAFINWSNGNNRLLRSRVKILFYSLPAKYSFMLLAASVSLLILITDHLFLYSRLPGRGNGRYLPLLPEFFSQLCTVRKGWLPIDRRTTQAGSQHNIQGVLEFTSQTTGAYSNGGNKNKMFYEVPLKALNYQIILDSECLSRKNQTFLMKSWINDDLNFIIDEKMKVVFIVKSVAICVKCERKWQLVKHMNTLKHKKHVEELEDPCERESEQQPLN
ncbi:hypothetical protein M0804_009131 [Polistes exclamans]|nr:hypothetical protein M0804_009131 [Polistes exclamans]